MGPHSWAALTDSERCSGLLRAAFSPHCTISQTQPTENTHKTSCSRRRTEISMGSPKPGFTGLLLPAPSRVCSFSPDLSLSPTIAPPSSGTGRQLLRIHGLRLLQRTNLSLRFYCKIQSARNRNLRARLRL